MRAELTIGRERWSEFWPAAAEMLEAHRLEVMNADLIRGEAFGVNVPLLQQLDAAGALVLMTARDQERLIGYCVWTVGPSLEHIGQMVGSQGPWYTRPEYRTTSAALRMFNAGLDELRMMGVTLALPHHWGGPAGERLDGLFRHMGATPMETVYSLRLGG